MSKYLMKNKLLLLLLIALPLMAVAQKRPRQVLHGKVVADTLKVDNLTVLNASSNISALTDESGSFTLYARPNDTLYFSSITFHSIQMVLKESDFIRSPLIVKLNVQVTVLDEVVITPLSGDLEKDSKDTKTLGMSFAGLGGLEPKYPVSQAPKNTAMPTTESSLKGVDFLKIYRMIFKKKSAKKDKGEIYGSGTPVSFNENVKGRFTHHFFTQTLKIPHTEIGLFLDFCDKGDDTRRLLLPENEFELTDYLIAKSEEYLKMEK